MHAPQRPADPSEGLKRLNADLAVWIAEERRNGVDVALVMQKARSTARKP